MRSYETILLSRSGRRLTITMNRPEVLNAVNRKMQEELADAFSFAASDEHSDVVVLTGAGRSFCAGGDLEHIAHNAAHPELFDSEARVAKRIVSAMLDLDKPLIARVNGYAVGLGATLALLCDVIFAVDTAKIGDPHVALALAAGDGGAALWPQRVGLSRAKEYLLTGQLLTATKAEAIGLINHCVAAAHFDDAVDGLCNRLLRGSSNAIRWTKVLLNLELKRAVNAVLDAGIAYEVLCARSSDHREAAKALQQNHQPAARAAARE